MQVCGDGALHELFRPGDGQANSVDYGSPQMLDIRMIDIGLPLGYSTAQLVRHCSICRLQQQGMHFVIQMETMKLLSEPDRTYKQYVLCHVIKSIFNFIF